ncbi:pantoate--beta-alanine ligase [Pontimonas salivibrio]|uniref:Pantothenate synthetase n=1 Tax=Pontimonas salivibrio TaxID=1159327 RepID=A0A2L2BN23_9MICO|nr:pantoate--beta-alanine ligase [Pontimonas salivibrio]AVG23047.1 pantoate--beta-alanine ligase [Pontimonas salivibrio]
MITSAQDMQAWSKRVHGAGETIGFVPTMGSLHRGHLSLIEKARAAADHVVVSIFVNPLQFGPGEDFERYPRSLESDLEALRHSGVDVVFTPGLSDIYPDGPENTPTLSAGEIGDVFEGEHRPGHFDGVLTVVARLFQLVACDVAVFGKKDAQQLIAIEQMVAREGFPVKIIRGDIVRDDDGLALSSRNVYLTPEGRADALILQRELRAIENASNTTDPTDSLERIKQARQVLREAPGIELDYLEAVSSDTFTPWEQHPTGEMVVVGAIRVGTTRLLDNVWMPSVGAHSSGQ